MGQGYSMLGFVVIMILYTVIGLMGAAGAILIARKVLAPKAEQIFYAMFLIVIAAFYLAFVAYFGVATPWRLETAVVVAFVAIGLLGARLPFVLIAGYSLHGLWDLLHEFQAHGTYSVFEPGQVTAIPLAYGVLCAAFDFCMAGYFYARRAEWITTWKAAHSEDGCVVGSSAAVASASSTVKSAVSILRSWSAYER